MNLNLAPLPQPAPLPPLPEVLQRWGAHLTRHRSANTTEGYRRDVRLALQFFEGRLGRPAALDDLTRIHVQAFLDETPGTARTVSRRAIAVRHLLRFVSEQMELTSCNFGPSLLVPRCPQRVPRFLSVEDAGRLVEAPLVGAGERPSIYALRDAAVLELLYGAGLRVSELRHLDLGQVLFDSPQPGDLSLRVVGKGDKERMVVVTGEVTEAVRRYLLRRGEQLPVGGDIAQGPLLLSERGRRLSRRRIFGIVQKWGLALGIHRPHPHLLRHSCATHLLWGGAELRAVQAFLGHASPAMTALYTHVNLPYLRAQATVKHPRSRPVLPAPPPQGAALGTRRGRKVGRQARDRYRSRGPCALGPR